MKSVAIIGCGTYMEKAMEGHVLADAELVGRYFRESY